MKQLLLLTAIALTMAGCSKKENQPTPVSPAVVTDANTVLLKEVVSQSLPNPYFHFTYDSLHHVKQINFASGFSIYNVEYANKQVSKMTNIKNGNRLIYSYSNNQVSEINEFSGLIGAKIFSYRFTYNNSQQLTSVQWLDYFADSSGNPFKKVILSYYTDGNLESIDQYSTTDGQFTWEVKKKFSNYDTKTNVDDFYLLEDFFDSHLFLPQVKLQKNNPQQQQLIFEQNEFSITYSYSYNGDLPLTKNGLMQQTRGNGHGQTKQIATRFNYY